MLVKSNVDGKLSEGGNLGTTLYMQIQHINSNHGCRGCKKKEGI